MNAKIYEIKCSRSIAYAVIVLELKVIIITVIQ